LFRCRCERFSLISSSACVSSSSKAARSRLTAKRGTTRRCERLWRYVNEDRNTLADDSLGKGDTVVIIAREVVRVRQSRRGMGTECAVV
jgi:hypothetical protein